MQEIGNMQVVLMGIGTVFICLIMLIVMLIFIGKIMQILVKDTPLKKDGNLTLMNVDRTEKQKIIAAISVAIAEELQTDVSKIQIQSIKAIKN